MTKPEDSKPPTPAAETKPTSASKPDAKSISASKPDNKAPETKPEPKNESKAGEGAADSKAANSTPADKNAATGLRAPSTAARADSPQDGAVAGPSNPGNGNGRDMGEEVYKQFQKFASKERDQAAKMRSNKLKQDTAIKLQELKKFGATFKLATPVPKDLIGIIAKDPSKQKEIEARAIKDAEDVQRAKTEAATVKDKQGPASASQPKPSTTDASAAATTSNAAPPQDARSNSRPSAPQHTPSPSGVQNRHPGPRQGPFPAQNYNQQFRPDRSPAHQPPAQGRGAPTGHLAERIRKGDQDRYGRVPVQHQQFLPPTGPANAVDPNFRRYSAIPAGGHMATKLNPNSHEFRPNPYTAPFNPNGPSAGSSPRSAVNHVESQASTAASPQVGQLTRRKTKAVDVNKCSILAHIKTITPLPGRNFDDNQGLRPSYDSAATWRQPKDDEKPDSFMTMTYTQVFERMPYEVASVATPNPPHAIPHLAHQHQLPFHLQQGAQPHARSPHMSHMQMQASSQGHGVQAPFNNGDDHRMMPSTSAQSYASPRMGHNPMYQQQMNVGGQLQYGQPMPQFMPGTPMSQYRTFSNNPQYMPQQGGPMAMPMMPPQQQFVGNPNMMPSGPQMPMFPGGQPQYMAPGPSGPQPIPGQNGYPSPGRGAVAPMMVQQGSQGGQPMYGISPSMQFQQPVYAQGHHPASKIPITHG
jgi:hypothetical protein